MPKNTLELDLAIALLECGELIPLDLAAKLLEQGVDVDALTEAHFPE